MPAKNIGGFPTAPTQVNLAAVGARNISRPTIVTHATQQGAVNVQQIRPSPGVVPASVTARAVAAQPNRAVIYRSSLLHSGAIAPGAALGDDPARGRLTVTAFLMLE